MYSDSKAWLQHMERKHTQQWCCSARSHSKLFFPSEDAFADHMRSCHTGAFAENHLPMLKRRAEVAGSAFTTCPLCTTAPKAVGSDSDRPVSGLAIHVANHLRSLALISVPFEEKDGDAGSQATASRQANESLDGRDEDLLEDLPSLSSDSDVASLEAMTDMTLHIDDPVSETSEAAGSHQNEWSFLGPMQYHGHDRDPTLQTFLRKLYLESSPTMSDLKGPVLPCWFVPFAKNPVFFGREYALNKAAEAIVPSVIASNPPLLDKPSNPRTFVLYGPGGMGKTQVAAEFVHRHMAEFDAILWAHGDDVTKLAQDFNNIAVKLGLVAEDSVDARDQVYTRELVKRWLVDPLKDLKNKESGKATWLLVYDSVEDPAILNDFWPYDGPGSILITSRNPFAWTSSLLLNPLSVAEGGEYLLKLTQKDPETEDLTRVNDVSLKLGGLPLALRQMAGIITNRKMTFAEFAHAYNERESRQQMLQTTPAPATQAPWYGHSVASVWALENLRHGVTLLNTLSMFDPDGISERLYTDTFGKIDLPGLPKSLMEYQQAKAELLGSSIVASEKSGSKFFVHRLVQDVARIRLEPACFRSTFMACVAMVSELWQFENFTWRHSVGRWSSCEELFPHIQRLRELAVQSQLFPSPNDCEGDFAFARLLTDAGWYHHERGRSAEARWFNDVAEEICRVWVERLSVTEQQRSNAQDRLRRLHANLAEIVHNRGCIVTETNQPLLAFNYLEEFSLRMTQEFADTPELARTDMRLAI